MGAYIDDVGSGGYRPGSAYIFGRSGGTWTQKRKLIASDGQGSDWFGKSVSIAGNTAVAGAPSNTVSTNIQQGAAYVFDLASYTTRDGLALVVPAPGVLANDSDADGDPLTAALLSQPTHGIVVLNPDGGFIYTPTIGFTGTDSFTYRAFDGIDYSNTATVWIQVTPALIDTASLTVTKYEDVDGDASSDTT